MSDSPARDEQEQRPATARVDDAIAEAQASAQRLQDAAAELEAQRAGAARRAATEQDRELERARLAVRSLMSHLESVHADVTTSTDRIRHAADAVARAAEEAAEEQLRALREQVEAAGSAVELVATGMAAATRDATPALAPVLAEPDVATAGAGVVPEPEDPKPLPEDPGSPATALVAEDAKPAPDDVPPLAPDAGQARLHAVNLALNAAPREETNRALVEDFGLEPGAAAALLDDVYRVADEAG